MRRKPLPLFMVIAGMAAILFLGATPALAGGVPYLEIDGQEEVAEQVSASEVFLARQKWRLRDWLKGGPFFAYLSPHIPGRVRQAPPLPNGAQRLGRITVGNYEKTGPYWAVRFGVDFTVPDVMPGQYRIDVCTDPCTQTIEALQPSVFRVVAGPVEERLHERIDALEQENVNALREVETRMLRKSHNELGHLRSAMYRRHAEQGARIDELGIALQRARRAANDRPFPLGVAALAFLAGTVISSAGWFFRRKAVRRAGLSPEKEEPTPISTAPGSRRKDRHALGA